MSKRCEAQKMNLVDGKWKYEEMKTGYFIGWTKNLELGLVEFDDGTNDLICPNFIKIIEKKEKAMPQSPKLSFEQWCEEKVLRRKNEE